MPRGPELIHDHVSPKQDLDHVLRDVRDLFRAVLGERSPYAGEAESIAGRVDCYKRGRDGLINAQRIVRQGLGGAHAVSLPEEHPSTETQMKRHARAAIRIAGGVAQRYGVGQAMSANLRRRRSRRSRRRRSRRA